MHPAFPAVLLCVSSGAAFPANRPHTENRRSAPAAQAARPAAGRSAARGKSEWIVPDRSGWRFQ